MNRSRALAWLAGGALAVLLVAVTTAGDIHLADAPPSIPWTIEPRGSEIIELPEMPPFEEPDDTEVEPIELPQVVVQLAVIGLIALASLAAVIILRAAWRNRPRLRWRRTEDPDFDVLEEMGRRDEIAASLAADADAQHRALQRGTPRNGIVECWLRLEASVAEAGLERAPAATSSEFTVDVLASFAVDSTAIEQLAALYREARFSSHALGEAARDRAIDALDSLHRDLARHREGERARGPATRSPAP